MKSIFRANLFILSIIVLQLIVEAFLVRDLVGFLGYKNLLILHQYIVLLIPALIYIVMTKQSPKEVFRLNKLSVIDAFIVVVIAFLSQPIASFLSQLMALFFENPVAQAFEILKTIPYPTMLFMMAITPAICEEAVTRGVVLHGYNKTSMLKAALINGLIFSILHLSPQQSLYTFILGVLFAYLVRITNSIWASVLCHFTFNGIQVTLTQLVKSTVNEETIKAAQEPLSKVQTVTMLGISFFVAVAFSAAIVGLLIYMNNKHKNVSKATVDNYEYSTNTSNFDINNERVYLYNDINKIENKVSSYAPLAVLILLYLALMMWRFS
jgi:membrane protease YdiL (CAAX protease family)